MVAKKKDFDEKNYLYFINIVITDVIYGKKTKSLWDSCVGVFSI